MQISIRNLSKAYDSNVALDDVSLEIEAGQIVVLLGPNGAGKTTLLRSLAGVAAAGRGEVCYDGQRFRRDRLDLRRRLGFLPDFPFVYPRMTVIRHIAMVLKLYQTPRDDIEDTVVELLGDFDLLPLAEMKLKTLSRGQLYKAALVALLAAAPEVMLIDEPFASGMDPRGLAAFRKHARTAAERGATVLYTTQILEVAEQFAEKVCIIHQGKIHAYDTLARLRRDVSTTAGVLSEIFNQLHEQQTP